MLTPSFKLTQDSQNLTLWMHVPYIKCEDAECDVIDNVFYFSSPPYYLRLHLPGEVLPDVGPSKYDVEAGDLTLTMKKKTPGESFEGLDMLTWLLTPRKSKEIANPNIEVLHTIPAESDENEDQVVSDSGTQAAQIPEMPKKSEKSEKSEKSPNGSSSNLDPIPASTTSTVINDNRKVETEILCDQSSGVKSPILEDSSALLGADVDTADDEDDDEIDWYFNQTVKNPDVSLPGQENKIGCGFALRRFNFGDISEESAYLIDIKDPNNKSLSERCRLREEQEEDKFDFEHYLADLFEDDMIKEMVSLEYPELTGVGCSTCELSEKESEKLTQLPKREYLIEPGILPQLYYGLVDLLFAYAYTHRFSHGEENVESDWIICKLSSTLSWCDMFCDMKDVLRACARRSLCFPLYRSWTFFEKVLKDVSEILKSGQTHILKCLLGILFILQKSEDRYALNDLYIIDYCVWIQSVSTDSISDLAKELSETTLSKADVGFRLVELEADAKKMMEENDDDDDDVDNLAARVKNVVKVSGAHESDSDDDDDESDECSGSDSDSDSDIDSSDDERSDSDDKDVVSNVVKIEETSSSKSNSKEGELEDAVQQLTIK